jgi:hypothetical protein
MWEWLDVQDDKFNHIITVNFELLIDKFPITSKLKGTQFFLHLQLCTIMDHLTKEKN